MTIPCVDNIVLKDETESAYSGSLWTTQVMVLLAEKIVYSFDDIDHGIYDVVIENDYSMKQWIEPETNTLNSEYTIRLLET
jgi:hypothetical protein